MDNTIATILSKDLLSQKQFIEKNLQWYIETLDVQGVYISVLAILLSSYKTKQEVEGDYKLSMLEYFCRVSAADIDVAKFHFCSAVESILEVLKEK